MTVPYADQWASGNAYESYIGRWSRLVAPEFLAWLGIPPQHRWLDVGCGTGALTGAVLALCDPGSVVGVEPSEVFLRHARAAIVDPRATFVAGTAAKTGIEAGAVDVVVSGLVLTFVPDLGEALTEARRVVSQGGVVAGYVWDYADGMQFVRRFWDAVISLDPTAREHDQAIRFAATAAEPLAAAFTAAGLTGVEVRPIEVPTDFADFDDLWTPFLGGTGTAPTYVASLAEPARQELRERLRATVAVEMDGSIRMTARAWAVRGRRPG